VPEIQEVFCDTASLTGVNLLRVLLAERGLKPVFRPLPDDRPGIECDAVLLIGDRAIDFRLAPHPHHIFDLGQAWYKMTGLPFVYAVWALRRGIDHAALRLALGAARDLGLNSLPEIIRDHPDYTRAFRKRYFKEHVQFGLGPREKAGIQRFLELLRKHGLGPVHEPRYVR
jgi:chorismate dehydratase